MKRRKPGAQEDAEAAVGKRAGGQGRLRARVDSGEAPTARIHLWPDLVAAGTSRKDHRSKTFQSFLS